MGVVILMTLQAGALRVCDCESTKTSELRPFFQEPCRTVNPALLMKAGMLRKYFSSVLLYLKSLWSL